ncbi:PAS domain S-box-containing protein [Haloarcula quadrata]|uniref:histidine kinase n=1 Tax=Haloarcula quadrata TaxID=182779 RepID=A0A495R7R2_9EURY|nr:PAS domain-containing protein [Haloarcula quadrata]RKS83357.1 PAS domain S-box-containing protein [Haloarcula quadrata]
MEDNSNMDRGGATAGESRSVYEAIFREMSDAAFLIDVEQSDEDYTFTYRRNNASHQEQSGLSEDELRGQTPQELLGDEQGTVVAGNYQECVEKGETIEYEEKLELPGGTSDWQTKLTPITDSGQVTQIVGVARDMTEKKEQERQLKRIHRRFETVMETMSAAVFLKDADDQYLMMNQACRELFNVEDQDIVGLTDEDLFPPDTAEQVRTDDRRVFENGEVIEIEETVPTTSGNTVRLTRKSPVYDEDGEVMALCGVSTDITERKQAERQLKENKERLTEQNTALESLAQIITDTERTVNQQITDLLDLGTTYLDLDVGILSEIDGSEYTVRNVVDPSKGITSGDSFDLTDTYCSLVYDADGPVSFHSATDGGVKDHPAYEKQGIESYIGVPVFVEDKRYGTLNFSRSESREEAITDAEESFVRIMAQWMGTELNRQQREEELERTSKFLQETQAVAKVGGWEVSLRSERMRWSEELYRIHGLPLDANPTPEEAIEFYHPDGRDTIREAFDRLTTEGEPYDLELRIVTADDEVRWVRTRGEPRYEDDEIVAVHGTFQDITERKEREEELNRSQQIIENSTDIATIIDPEGTITYVSSAVKDVLGHDPEELIGANGFRYQPEETQGAVADAVEHVLDNPAETKRVQTRFRRADSSWCWIESTLRNRLDDNVIDGILVSSRDITERKEREQELHRQNSRLNEFASVISHDLRNPLNVAQGRAAILQQRDDDELQEHLTPLVRSLDRMESIIEDTLTLARQGETVGGTDPISVVDLIGKCWAGVETGEATLEIEDEFTLRGDHDRLQHVFENLFRNAVEHGGEDVTVWVGRCGEDCLYVEDDGPGIPPSDRDAVLEPGHTSVSGGTGFGLTIVKRIAEAHGWEVAITDGRDGGARFEFDTAGLPDK